MKRTALSAGQEVVARVGRWRNHEAVIVSVDRSFAQQAHRLSGRRVYHFQGRWEEAVAVAYKLDDGTWKPSVTTTRNVVGPLDEVRAQEAEHQRLRKLESLERRKREIAAAERREARLEAHPAVVAQLNEFVGADAFSVSYNGQIRVNGDRVIAALTDALGLEVLS